MTPPEPTLGAYKGQEALTHRWLFLHASLLKRLREEEQKLTSEGGGAHNTMETMGCIYTRRDS